MAEQLDIRGLSSRMMRIMKGFRKQVPLSARENTTGHYMLPICLDGRPAYKVLIWSRTPGCAWSLKGGCTFCDFGFDPDLPSGMSIERQFVSELEKLDPKTRYLHMGPGGSVFQNREIEPGLRRRLYEAIGRFERLESFGIETRAELVTDAEIETIASLMPASVWEVPIGFGLESSSNLVRNVCCNKGETEAVLISALERINSYAAYSVGASGKTISFNADLYVLLKPPFLSEREAVEDAVSSVKWAFSNGAATVSVFPVVPKTGTLTDWLMHRDELEQPLGYKPPFLFSIFEVLRRLPLDMRRKTLILGQTSGVPSSQGLRSCRYCRPNLEGLAVMHDHSRDISIPNLAMTLRCGCYIKWKEEMETEAEFALPYRMPSYVDFLENHFVS